MDVMQLISNVGFPIACALGMGYYVIGITKQQSEENVKREDRLYNIIDEQSKQMSELKTSIDKLNDTIMQKGI